MDDKKIARELVRIAKELTAGISRSDIFNLHSKTGGNANSEILALMTSFTKEFAGDGSATGKKNAEIHKVLSQVTKKVAGIEKKYKKEIDKETGR